MTRTDKKVSIHEIKVVAARLRLKRARRGSDPDEIRAAEEELAWAEKERDSAGD